MPSKSNRRDSRSIKHSNAVSTSSRRRSTRFITIASDQSPPTNNILSLSTLSSYEESLTDVSALNTQNDTIQPSLGTRVAMQQVLPARSNRRRSVVKSQKIGENSLLRELHTGNMDFIDNHTSVNDADISSIDPNLDNETVYNKKNETETASFTTKS